MDPIVHLVGVFAVADDRIHWRSPLFYGLSNARLRGVAIAFDLEDPRRGRAEDRVAFGRTQRRRLDDGARIGVADAEGIIRAEHDPVGADDIAEEAQRARLEQHGVEIEPAETVERAGILGVDRLIAV